MDGFISYNCGHIAQNSIVYQDMNLTNLINKPVDVNKLSGLFHGF